MLRQLQQPPYGELDMFRQVSTHVLNSICRVKTAPNAHSSRKELGTITRRSSDSVQEFNLSVITQDLGEELKYIDSATYDAHSTKKGAGDSVKRVEHFKLCPNALEIDAKSTEIQTTQIESVTPLYKHRSDQTTKAAEYIQSVTRLCKQS